MKNLINYLYGIYINKITSYNSSYIICDDKNIIYLFSKLDNVNNINLIKNILIKSNPSLKYYHFKFNIYNDVCSYIDGSYYTLVVLDNDYNMDVDFIDMISFYDMTRLYNYKPISWEILWESKIDYFLSQDNINEIKDKKIAVNFWYYIGIAENALLYLKRVNLHFKPTPNDVLCFSHRRILVPCKKIDFYNPNEFIVDYKVRDVAEYIKSLFYSNKDYFSELEYFLKTNSVSVYSASILYARIVYPSIFFDYYESREEIFSSSLLSNFEEYEKFLKKTYELINSYVSIDKISWL